VEMSIYSDNEFGYSIEYPSDWQTDMTPSHGSFSAFSDSSDGAGISVQVEYGPSGANPVTPIDFYHFYLSHSEQNLTDTKLEVLSEGECQFGQDITGYKATWLFTYTEATNTAKDQLFFSCFSVNDWNIFYTIAVVAPEDKFQEYTPIFEEIVNSFKIFTPTIIPNKITPNNITLNINTGLPDLIIESVNLQEKEVFVYDCITCSYKVKNIGGEGPAGDSSFCVGAFLSKDRELDNTDVELPTQFAFYVYHPSYGWSRDGQFDNLQIPSGISPGEYYIIVVADIERSFPLMHGIENLGVEESDENNNWLASTDTITVSSLYQTSTTPSLTPAPGAVNVHIDITFTWPAVAGAVSYEFEIAEETGQSDKFYIIEEAASTTTNTYKLDRNLKRSTQYWWRVRSVNSSGAKGDWIVSSFTTVQATTISTSQSQIPELGAVDVPIDITFTWPAVAGAISYEFEIAEETGQSAMFNIIHESGPTTVNSFKLTNNLKYNTTYWWRIRVINSSGVNSDWMVSFFTTER
jgi:hypothetical protein